MNIDTLFEFSEWENATDEVQKSVSVISLNFVPYLKTITEIKNGINKYKEERENRVKLKA